MKKTLLSILSVLLVLTTTIVVYAADKKYKLKDIDLTIALPEEVIVFTRETTSSNPNYDYIDQDPLAFTANMEQKKMFLYAFDKDKTYDISVICTKADNSQEDYNLLSEEEINNIIKINGEDISEIANVELKECQVVDSSSARFLHFMIENSNKSDGLNTVYIDEYETIYNGFVYTFKLQTYGSEASEDVKNIYYNMINSLDFSELEGSSLNNRMFHEAIELLIGAGMVIAFLGLILFIMISSQKKHKKNAW